MSIAPTLIHIDVISRLGSSKIRDRNQNSDVALTAPVVRVGIKHLIVSQIVAQSAKRAIKEPITINDHFAIECNSHARNAYKLQTCEDGICLPDPVAMCIALDPSVGTSWSEHYVEIETQSELTRGMTVVDRLNVGEDERNRQAWHAAISGGHKAKVCWTIDNQRWKRALYKALG